MRSPPFTDHRSAALALLNSGERITRKGGSFLGHLCADPTPMTPAQSDWLATLLDWDICSVRPRFTELRRLGRIKDSGQRRKGRTRCSEIVWTVADQGVAHG